MSLEAGKYHVLKVERDSPFGYFLNDGFDDVLLHFTEINKQKIEIGEEIEVFLYSDHKGRVSATLDTPIIALNEVEFLEVKDFQPKMGFFLDNGLLKQILLPIAELPEEKAIWPDTESGDKLLVKLVHDKQGRLLANLVKSDEAIEDYIQLKLKNEEQWEIGKNQFAKGIVLHHLTAGTKIYLENNQVGFLHKDEQINELRLGQEIKVRITYIREDKRINLSMKPLKAVSRLDDSEMILEVLNNRGGAMPYWDKTQPDIIMEKFKMSKAAFKRALGKLMKDGLVYQEDGWTYLKKDEIK